LSIDFIFTQHLALNLIHLYPKEKRLVKIPMHFKWDGLCANFNTLSYKLVNPFDKACMSM